MIAIFQRLAALKNSSLAGSLDEGAARGGNSVRFAGRPQQQMRIEEQLHASPPNSRSISLPSIRSKSSGTEIFAAQETETADDL